MTYKQRIIAERREHNVCIVCGKNKEPERQHLSTCVFCYTRSNASQKRIRQERREVGICWVCGVNPPVSGKTRCLECRAKLNAYLRKREPIRATQAQARKLRVFERYGGCRCGCCGETCPTMLTMDHINNDGAEHRRTMKRSIYHWLEQNNYPKGFQVLCFNCNIAKHVNGGICPHQQPSRLELVA
jgi:hypothetical protein